LFEKFFDGWTLSLTALQIPEPKHSHNNGIIASFSNSKIQCYSNNNFQHDEKTENVGDFLSDIKKTLAKKAKHYGELNNPYIIILNVLSNNIFQSVIEDALLNETLKNGRRALSPFLSKQTNVNGVLVFYNLDPWNMMDSNIPRKESLYFINSNASEGFDHGNFRNLFGNKPLRKNVHILDRTKLSVHLNLPQEEWCNALKKEDPDSKHKKAVDWMQNWLLSNMYQEDEK
jgi:hypothetical protein